MFAATVRAEVAKLAASAGIEPAAVLAVADVESAGIPFWTVKGVDLPAIRFEGHYFYKKLTGEKLASAVRAGLASPKAGAVANPSSYEARYALFARAHDIDPVAAIESTSFGLGQVMGDHWKKLGFPTAQALVESCATVAGQIDLMLRYIVVFGLKDELQSKGWKSFADQYNGPASAKNHYAEKIAAAYSLYTKLLKGTPTTPHERAPWIADLATLGYTGGTAVTAFQRAQGLVVDGVVGPMTLAAIAKALAAKKQKTAKRVMGTGAMSAAAVSAAGETIKAQAAVLSGLGISSDTFAWITGGLSVAGVALVLYGVYMNWKWKNA